MVHYCRKIYAEVNSVYEKIKQQLEVKKEEDFEIVFASRDHNQVEFAMYFETMPWIAIPFDDPTIKTLAKYFDIQGISRLVVLGLDDKTVTNKVGASSTCIKRMFTHSQRQE
ncbi:hypothetical protein T459_15094 [Capsicum annuum]|uniref:protein-disulfide reductase n=1 Tax=Capsicum annuum TaxID=4072 RepID=A0A2G2ZJA0_CAPAN|nr:hypothetical protein T459_15094 [Capsicum annuum]